MVSCCFQTGPHFFSGGAAVSSQKGAGIMAGIYLFFDQLARLVNVFKACVQGGGEPVMICEATCVIYAVSTEEHQSSPAAL